MIIPHITSQPDLWNAMISPPILVSKGNVMIGYNPIYEYAAVPDVERIISALRRSVETKQGRAIAVGAETGREKSVAQEKPLSPPPSTTAGRKQIITVPIMGE